MLGQLVGHRLCRASAATCKRVRGSGKDRPIAKVSNGVDRRDAAVPESVNGSSRPIFNMQLRGFEPVTLTLLAALCLDRADNAIVTACPSVSYSICHSATTRSASQPPGNWQRLGFAQRLLRNRGCACRDKSLPEGAPRPVRSNVTPQGE